MVLLLVACESRPHESQGSDKSRVFDPTLPLVLRQEADLGNMEARESGAMRRDGPCLYLTWGSARHLIVWIDDVRAARLDDTDWVLNNWTTSERFVDGDYLRGSGGGYPDDTDLEWLTGTKLPAGCEGPAVQMGDVRKVSGRERPDPLSVEDRDIPPVPPPPPRLQDLQGRPVPALVHPDALEALFRHQFRNNASGAQQNAAAFCLEVEGRDAPPEFLRRFAGTRPEVKAASACEFRQVQVVDKASGRPALIHFVSDFACDGNVCEARGGYREANLSSSINRYRLEYDDGRWKVTQDIMEAIS